MKVRRNVAKLAWLSLDWITEEICGLVNQRRRWSQELQWTEILIISTSLIPVTTNNPNLKVACEAAKARTMLWFVVATWIGRCLFLSTSLTSFISLSLLLTANNHRTFTYPESDAESSVHVLSLCYKTLMLTLKPQTLFIHRWVWLTSPTWFDKTVITMLWPRVTAG